jgi:aconitate decarboxylase
MLTMGWHSGAVFGPSASAAAASKLMHLPANLIEDALGIACTQACGLMSAQYESEVKRMQHGFAARSGLLGALLARGNYVGIKRVFEREYGGFLAQFSQGNGKEPMYKTDEIAKDLGSKWQIDGVRVKPYASMAATHGTVDCVRALQKNHPEQMRYLKDISSINIEMGEVAYHHGGFKAERPLTATGAQMSAAYVAITQMVDHEVLAAQFRHDKLERDEVWELVDKTACVQTEEFNTKWAQRITVTFKDKSTIVEQVQSQRGVDPPLSNEEVVEKWRALTKGVIDDKRRQDIEDLVLNLEDCKDIALLGELMAGETKNPIA